MTIETNCKVYSKKKEILEEFCKYLDEMYSANYDALIDALRTFDGELTIRLIYHRCCEDLQDLAETLEIAQKENANITVEWL